LNDNDSDNRENLSKGIVEVLMGEKGEETLKEEWIPVAKALDDPKELPFLMDQILDIEATDELRHALVRVQINAQLRMKEDLNFYNQQLFAARSIEILLYESLKLKSKRRKKKS